MALRARITRAWPHRQMRFWPAAGRLRAALMAATASLPLALIVGVAPGLAETPPAKADRAPVSPQAPQRGDGAGGDRPAGPPMREDEPGVRGRENPSSPDADEEASPPSGSGCPYRGRQLELIV